MSIDDILLLKDNQVCCFRGIMPNGDYVCATHDGRKNQMRKG